MAHLVARAIRRPLQRATDVAKLIAQGDLTSRIEVHTRDDTSDMLRTLAEMQA
jgi:methyl-accepting chemotaxis protein